MDPNFIPEDRVLKVLLYGKYTFDKYVEGNITATLTDNFSGTLIQEKQQYIKDQIHMEFHLDKPEEMKQISDLMLFVELTEKQTGKTQSENQLIKIRQQRYNIFVAPDSIQYQNNIPYRLKATVQYWNATKVLERTTSVKMNHGSKDYESYLDSNGDATFEFDHELSAEHKFLFKDSKYIMPNIYADASDGGNTTEYYCKLTLKGGRYVNVL